MKQRQVWKNIVLGLAIFSTSFSVFVLIMHKQALEADLYIEALRQSEIYSVTADITEAKVSKALVSFEKELVEKLVSRGDPEEQKVLKLATSFVLDTIIEQQTPVFVSNVFEKIQFEQLLQNVTEEAIQRDIAWFKGTDETVKIFSYIPTTEQLDELQNSSLIDVFSGVTQEVLGFNDLPECASNEEVLANVKKISQGQVRDVTCTSEQIDLLLQKSIDDAASTEVLAKVETKVDESIDEDSAIKAVIADIRGVSYALAEFKQVALSVRESFWVVHDVVSFALLLSVILTIGAVILSKERKRLQTLIAVYFYSGLAIVFLALVYSYIISNIIISKIPYDKIVFGTNAITQSEVLLLTNSIQSTLAYVAKGLVRQDYIVGIWMVVLSALAFGILKLVENRKAVSKKISEISSSSDKSDKSSDKEKK